MQIYCSFVNEKLDFHLMIWIYFVDNLVHQVKKEFLFDKLHFSENSVLYNDDDVDDDWIFLTVVLIGQR